MVCDLLDPRQKAQQLSIVVRDLAVNSLPGMNQGQDVFDFVGEEAVGQLLSKGLRGTAGKWLGTSQSRFYQRGAAKAHIDFLPVHGKDAQEMVFQVCSTFARMAGSFLLSTGYTAIRRTP
jgi:hypothetical protein